MRIVRPALLACLIALGPALCGDLRADEFLCEEAHAHLKECCPGFTTVATFCDYVDGCDDGSTYPALTPDESNCIRAASCDTLVANGICARVAALHQRDSEGAGSDAGVCP